MMTEMLAQSMYRLQQMKVSKINKSAWMFEKGQTIVLQPPTNTKVTIEAVPVQVSETSPAANVLKCCA